MVQTEHWSVENDSMAGSEVEPGSHAWQVLFSVPSMSRKDVWNHQTLLVYFTSPPVTSFFNCLIISPCSFFLSSMTFLYPVPSYFIRYLNPPVIFPFLMAFLFLSTDY